MMELIVSKIIRYSVLRFILELSSYTDCIAQVILPNLSWALDLTAPRKEGSLAKDLPSSAKDRPKTRVGTQHHTTPPKQ